jgi:hypothetical protein
MDKDMIDYSNYLKVCKEAAQDDEVFKNFKRNPDYVPILEHVNYEQGLEYIKEIKRIVPNYFIKPFISEFIKNDKIGNPNIFYFNEIHTDISPTTLRYIKVLSDLISIFGNLDHLNIIEIGGGYGGQCRIIHDIVIPKSYTIVDLPVVLSLTGKYLKDCQYDDDIILRDPDDPSEIYYDLCISNYAFTEIDRQYQAFYADKIIKNSDKGYITCNFIANDNFTKDEIFALKSNHTIYEEKPLTGDGNLIYTWK